jgi:CrcB protein
MGFLIVFLGGGFGAAARHGVNLAIGRRVGLPLGTLTTNVLGSFLMGAIIGYLAFKGEASQHWRLFLTTGFFGGFTTFSAFSLETVLFFQRGELALASLYVAASVGLAALGLFAGLSLLRHFS